MAIRPDIDIGLEEIEDWNCCGATEYWSVHQLKAHALVGRNLALAEQQANGYQHLGCRLQRLLPQSGQDGELSWKDDKLLNSRIADALAAGGSALYPRFAGN